MQYKDYYKTLGVERDATQEQIKRAYRKLARKYHPDVSKADDAEEQFKTVGEAYEVLKDPEKRSAYDQFGEHWKEGQGFAPPPDWDAGFEFSGAGFSPGQSDQRSQFSDFFESLFGQSADQHGPGGYQQQGFNQRGDDHHAKIVISLQDSFKGATRTVTLSMPSLDSAGHLLNRPHNLRVKIPKGIKAGQRIRLAGQGSPAIGQAEPGDLYLEIQFDADPQFQAKGRDIHHQLPVTPWEAALGGTVPVPTLDGEVDLKVPPNSRSGQQMRLKGRGLPGSPPGDQYATLQVVLPPADSDQAREHYQQMADQLNFDPRQTAGA